MSPPSTFSRNRFSFGIELEMKLRPKDTPRMRELRSDLNWEQPSPDAFVNRIKLRGLVAAVLIDGGIQASTSKGNTAVWTATEDPSLSDGSDGFWGVELISPIMWSDENWHRRLEDVYKYLNNFDMAIDYQCSTHIHISPSEDDEVNWTLADLQSILKAAVYFEEALTKVMPAERKSTPWARGNFGSPNSPTLFRDTYYKIVKGADGFAPLFAKLDGITSPDDIRRIFEGGRYWTWNFSHVCETDSCGTVEFRRPPGSATLREAIHWASFAMSFIVRAVRTTWDPSKLTGVATVDELQHFVSRGHARLPEISQKGLVIPLLAEIGDDAIPVSAEEEERIRQIKLQKMDEPSPFVAKLRSASNSPASSRRASSGSEGSGGD